MIKFRYKRKESTTNNGGSNANTILNGSTKNNKSVEIKSNETSNKDDNKPKALKCEAIDQPVHKPMTNIDTTQTATIKTKTNIEQEYMEDCIRAIVVSEFNCFKQVLFIVYYFFFSNCRRNETFESTLFK